MQADVTATSTNGNGAECLLEDELLEYEAGRCSQVQLERLDAHLDGCASCRELVHHLVGDEKSGEDDDQAACGNGWLTTFTPGSLVASRYLIQRFVGNGGMGEVYEAFDRLMTMRVALKTVLCTASDLPHAVHKLMDEVKNALRVGHPHVCRINELQEHRDALNPSAAVPFFTMEFVEGERLGHRTQRGPLPLADTRHIAHQLLDGLKAAHARGVLHLDFKSDNVMLRRGKTPPEAVIMDFGLSRALDRPSRQPTAERPTIAGTLPYMSVEQLESCPTLRPATDVYSFGVVLYEMLTGRWPFLASSSGALLLEQLQTRPPPASDYVPSLSPALDRFVLRCLRSEPSQRFVDAGAALEALEAVGDWEREREARVRPWHLLAIAAACALALVVAVDVIRREPVTVVLRPLAAGRSGSRSGVTVGSEPLGDVEDVRAVRPVLALRAGALAGREATGQNEGGMLQAVARARHERRAAMAGDGARGGQEVARGAAAAVRDENGDGDGPRDENGDGVRAGEAGGRVGEDGVRASEDGEFPGDDWTPRALPRSLLAPGRRSLSGP